VIVDDALVISDATDLVELGRALRLLDKEYRRDGLRMRPQLATLAGEVAALIAARRTSPRGASRFPIVTMGSMSTSAVAKHLGISPRAVRYRVEAGQLRAYRDARSRLRFDRADVDAAAPRRGAA